MYGSLGEVAINKIPVASNQAILGIVPKNKEDVEFLYYWFLYFKPRWRKFAKPTTQANLTAEIVKNVKLPYPPLEERKGIVDILSSVDAYIQKVDEIIAKTERLKKGLMKELLTGRIRVEEKDGKIVFRKETEFKEDTEIGKIPKDWGVMKLKDVCIRITDGSHWSPKQVEKSDYRIATVANLKEFYIDINSCKFISEEDYQRLLKDGDVPEDGDVLFSKDGTVGICFTFKQSNYKIGLLSSIAIIKPNHDILFSDFLVYVLKSDNILWQVKGRKKGTALTRITLEDLKKIKIPIPPIQEQQKIAEILLTIDNKLELERKRKEKLERIKKSLMDLLLTGKIRVRI
jgi:type I restriction enzyme S subunit